MVCNITMLFFSFPSSHWKDLQCRYVLYVKACSSVYSSTNVACSGLHSQADYTLVSGQEGGRERERGRRRRGSGRARDVVILDDQSDNSTDEVEILEPKLPQPA